MAMPGSASAVKAPKRDQIKGSDRNRSGSASASRGGIELSETIVKSLSEKAKSHNESSKHKADVGTLKAVYRRGAGAYSSSHDPNMSRGQWAMARVNAYLKLLRSGEPDNPKYTTDYDLLPKSHPKSTRSDRRESYFKELARKSRLRPDRKPRSKPKPPVKLRVIDASSGFGTAQNPSNQKIPRFRVVDEAGNVVNAFNRKKEAENFMLRRQRRSDTNLLILSRRRKKSGKNPIG